MAQQLQLALTRKKDPVRQRKDQAMAKLIQSIKGHARRAESGQAMVEYALLLALIAVAAIGAITTFSNELSATFNMVADELANAVP
jgi:Flp pilus assembly pilin Flp